MTLHQVWSIRFRSRVAQWGSIAAVDETARWMIEQRGEKVLVVIDCERLDREQGYVEVSHGE